MYENQNGDDEGYHLTTGFPSGPSISPQYQVPSTPPSLEATVFTQVSWILRPGYNIGGIIASFFAGIHLRLPILSRRSVESYTPYISERSSAGHLLLFLAIYLLELDPPSIPGGEIEAYVIIKQMLGLLEAHSSHSLTVMQYRVLVIIYELGHGFLTAASTSLGSCTRAARMTGLKGLESLQEHPASTSMISEERRRVWWAIFLLDRFINLCAGDAMFGMSNAKTTDRLPSEDNLWLQDQVAPLAGIPQLNSPFNANFGQFARECQIANIAGRVCGHVFEPTSDHAFHTEEAAQLERTLLAYLPLLHQAELSNGRYCAALAITCR